MPFNYFIKCCLLFFFLKFSPSTFNMQKIQRVQDSFAKGADVSWITEMEDGGRKFYNKNGHQEDIFKILKGLGMNTVRFRIWVNPVNKYNSIKDVISKCNRAKAAGMRIMIDLHYSDSWADPGKQTIPAGWAGQNFSTLKTTLSNYTSATMNTLLQSKITPEWVQIGNETNDGMLWPVGKASVNMSHFAQLVQAGSETVKSVFPSAKIIIHLSNGYDHTMYRWMFDSLMANHVHWDVIGMSLYPSASTWQTLNEQCLSNMRDMIQRYGKEVMVVECGMKWDQPLIAKRFLSDLIYKVKSLPKQKGLGVLYWEPESYNHWKGYKLGAFNDSGKPTKALDAFK